MEYKGNIKKQIKEEFKIHVHEIGQVQNQIPSHLYWPM